VKADAGLLGGVLQGGQQDGNDGLDLRVPASNQAFGSIFVLSDPDLAFSNEYRSGSESRSRAMFLTVI